MRFIERGGNGKRRRFWFEGWHHLGLVWVSRFEEDRHNSAAFSSRMIFRSMAGSTSAMVSRMRWGDFRRLGVFVQERGETSASPRASLTPRGRSHGLR